MSETFSASDIDDDDDDDDIDIGKNDDVDGDQNYENVIRSFNSTSRNHISKKTQKLYENRVKSFKDYLLKTTNYDYVVEGTLEFKFDRFPVALDVFKGFAVSVSTFKGTGNKVRLCISL